jgi:hypothetical protein
MSTDVARSSLLLVLLRSWLNYMILGSQRYTGMPNRYVLSHCRLLSFHPRYVCEETVPPPRALHIRDWCSNHISCSLNLLTKARHSTSLHPA